ncbi:MAG: fabD [Rhodospirillales bacterium]|nr:fabD [Rhodospirillales bacterium]
MARAFVFPGQGSQEVGMGRDLAEAFAVAREVFEEVDDALGFNLRRVMLEGPEAELQLTENAQPALMAMSLAVLRVLQTQSNFELGTKCSFVAGHSLGEYSALTAAGTFALADAARVLKERGRAMQQAVPVGKGAMAALLGVELEAAEEIAAAAAQGGVCAAANDNAPGQIVISGDADAVDRALAIAAERGFKRAIKLPVSAPFHCALMQPAADRMAEVLAATKISFPAVPVIANVTAVPTSDPDEIRKLLVEQVTSRVRWRECVLAMKAHNVDTVVEIGAGKVLTGLTKRIDKELTGISVSSPADVEAFLKTL